MTDKIAVLCTCASDDEARRIASALISSRLAACVNLLPAVQSIYHWKGAVEEGTETLMIIKSALGLFERLRDEIIRLHSYETPEIIAVPIVEGAAGYLAWMDDELRRAGSE
jgi:periplasmic divalent cation tolerance protein